jgi:biotin carboxylase
VFVPADRSRRDFSSIEDINNHLLRDPEVREWIRSHGPGGKVAFVMFDEETEALAAELGLEIVHPAAALRERLDSKIVTTRLGNDAGVPSVPNVLGHAASYEALLALAAAGDLGTDLVVQTPYGDSGKTTFFIASRADWERDADELAGQELKVMRRIRNFEVAVEAAITRHGTIVGPFMTSLVGHPELTPYKGGWCGNDIFPDALDEAQRERARAMTERLGARLAEEGYRGFFEVDYLVDRDSGELYLGELNPRVSGASSMTNVTAGAYADMPLFLFHLLEYMDVDYELDVDEINARWARTAAEDVWSQLIVKETSPHVELLTAAPRTGVYKLDDAGRISFARWANDWHNLIDETEAFYLQVAAPGDYRYKGADLGVLVTRGRLQSDDDQLTERCRLWIDGIAAQFAGTPVGASAPYAGAALKSGPA